jgi:hypothetical protein
MTLDRWERIQVLFETALAQPMEARRAFVESATGTDTGLRDEVNALLAAHERESGGDGVAGAVCRPPQSSGVGRR